MNNYKEKYLKYKLKYLNLKKNNFVGGGTSVCANATEAKPPPEYQEAITKTIDDITFTLMYKCTFKKHNHIRGIKIEDKNFKVYIKSNKDGVDKYFFVYPSHSDLGFWKLAYYGEKGWYKGPDYVQSSFISLELQHFINETLSKLPHVNYGLENELGFFHRDIVNSAIMDVINDGNRQKQLENAKIKALLEITDRNRCGIQVKLNDIKAISDLLCELYEINDDPFPSHEFSIKKDMVVNYNKFFIEGDVHSVKLKSKQDVSENIILYYFDVTISIENNDEGSTSDSIDPFKIAYPILAIKEETKINEYGVYTEYINLSSYICKVFEYTHQVDFYQFISRLNEQYKPVKIDRIYSYIGNFYKEIFPIKDIYKEIKSEDIKKIPEEDLKSGCLMM